MKHPRLIYLMGASGVGKDSLLNYLRAHPLPHSPLLVARRVITRPAGHGIERHIPVSESEFRQRLENHEFAMHWQSHGYHYGISKEIDLALSEGHCVVVNGSRQYLPMAMQHYPNLVPVLLEADPEVIRERLLKRGRETLEAIQERVCRNAHLGKGPNPAAMVVIDNNGPIEAAGTRLMSLLKGSGGLNQADEMLQARPA